jgi:hypothetical protein
MDQRPLEPHRRYLLKHTSQTVPIFLSSIDFRTDLGTLNHEPAATLHMNDIGSATLSLLRPIAVDLYGENRGTGAFILIDAETNGTVAAGMITEVHAKAVDSPRLADGWGPLTAGEREARWGHRGGVLELKGPKDLVDAIERSLFAAGAVSVRIDADDDAFVLHPRLLEVATTLQVESGLIALVVSADDGRKLTARVEGQEITLEAKPTSDEGDVGDAGGLSDASSANKIVAAVHQFLHDRGIFISSERAGL